LKTPKTHRTYKTTISLPPQAVAANYSLFLRMKVSKILQKSPKVRLLIGDGSERATYMPQEQALKWLGTPHSGINLMSNYYPKQSFWPERRLFSEKVFHYRHSPADARDHTPLEDINDWTDGYFSFDIKDPRNDVIQQMEDVRRFGQDVRLTLTAEVDTSDEDLRTIAEMIKPFAPLELRLNHEASDCGWFRFAQGVDKKSPEEAKKIYRGIAEFFVRAKKVMTDVCPDITFCFCDDAHYTSDDELGLMLKEPNVIPGIDCYGSLHYGWPGHKIENPPIIGAPFPPVDQAVYRTPGEVCEEVFLAFKERISKLRNEDCRIDLGEFNYDEDIHGSEIRAQLVHDCYRWFAKHPDVIGSVVHYQLTDRGGLGLLFEPEYNALEKVVPSQAMLDMYREVLQWPEFTHPVETLEDRLTNSEIKLRWETTCHAEGIRIEPDSATSIDLGTSYWHRAVITGKDGKREYLHSDSSILEVPKGTQSVEIYALPVDGRNNAAGGFERSIPLPVVKS